jgi:RNA polymerase sigma-70 factor, ECF subfamily
MDQEPGDADAKARRFMALALPHLDAAYNLARWLARDDHDARDIVQDALLRALRAFDGFRGDQLRPWLLAIVRNTCFTWLQQNRPGALQVPYDEELHADSLQAAPADGPEHAAVRRDDRRAIDAALARLPCEFREVVILRELEDLSYRDIAGVLAIPIGTVMSRLARARAMLQRLLQVHVDGGSDGMR